MAPRKRADKPADSVQNRRPAPTGPRRPPHDVSPLMENSAAVLGAALRARNMTDTALARAVKTTSASIGRKRHGEIPLSIRDIEEYAAVLRIPAELFLRPLGDLYGYLAIEAGGGNEKTGRDLPRPQYPWIPDSAGHVQEIDLRDTPSDRFAVPA
jgi:transcriptional regulator with XRE-family HTH domain